MTHQAIIHKLAIVFLTCVAIVTLIDWLGQSELSQRFGWTYLWYVWYAARYIGAVCGILLALDVLF